MIAAKAAGKPLFYAVVGLAALCILAGVAIDLRGSFSTSVMGDFGIFLASGQAIRIGVNPYGPLPIGPHSATTNLDPPILLPLFALLSRLPVAMARAGWAAASLARYVASLAIVWRFGPGIRNRWHLLWALALAGFWLQLSLGNIYALLGLIAAGAWVLLSRKRWLPAGVLIGVLCAVKPQFLIWPGLLLLAGAPAAAVVTVLAMAALSALPLFIYGPAIYGQWSRLILSGFAQPGPYNASLIATGWRLDLPWLGWLAAICLGSSLAWIAWRRRISLADASTLAILGALLISPISWLGYTVLLVPGLLKRTWPVTVIAGCVMLLVPAALVFPSFNLQRPLFAILGSLYTWALLLILAGLLRETFSSQPLPATTRNRRRMSPNSVST